MSIDLFRTLKSSQIFECSFVIDSSFPNIPVPNRPEFTQTNLINFTEYGFCKSFFSLCGDHGTHIDAPYHRIEAGRKIHELTGSELIGYGVIIDVSQKCNENNTYQLTVQDLIEWEERNGQIPEGSFVCMRSGWSQKIGDMREYYCPDENHLPHFPTISAELAIFLVRERNIVGVGIDAPFPDLPKQGFPHHEWPVHDTILGADKYIIEHLNLKDVPEAGAIFFSLPAFIRDAPESVVRVLAIVPKQF